MRIEQNMTPSRFRALSEAFGGDIERWPPAERESARAFAAHDAQAGAALAEARRLDRLMAMVPPAPEATPQLIDRIVAAAPLQSGGIVADNVIVLPRGARTAAGTARDPSLVASSSAAASPAAGWQLKAGRLAGASGLLAASLLIGVWLGATGLGGTLGGTTFGPRQAASDADVMSEIVQAAFPPELGEMSDEDSL